MKSYLSRMSEISIHKYDLLFKLYLETENARIKKIVTSHINCIAARCLSLGMCLYQVMMALIFLNDVANDAEST